MKRIFILSVLAIIALSCNNKIDKDNKPPNIIYFLADDLGYGEVGVYGQQKIETPNIDVLAQSGMLFTQHYTGAPVCAPARYVFLTGKHAGHAYIRGNDEWDERGDVWNYKKVYTDSTLEGQRPIPSSTITLGSLLQDAGYKTSIFGKWGLGAPNTEGVPNLQGFDYFYGYNCQRQAHNLCPSHLWENSGKVLLDNDLVSPHTKLDPLSDPYKNSSYKKYNQKIYAPDVIQQKALTYIKEHKEHPFFMYYASPLPHVPLQAPKEYIDKYRKIFGEEEPYLGNQGYFPTRHPKATYAAMITYMDHQLGELIASLKEEGIYENTIIIFSSDNGPTYTGGVDFNFFESSKPFTNGYGRTKGFLYEGGIRIPMIASWPNKIKKGTTSKHISVFYDLLPTVCDIVGIETPKDLDGISFKQALFGKEQKPHDYLYWEFPSYSGQQAVRMGQWKGIRKDILKGNLTLELYNLDVDIKEQNNISELHPDIVKKMEKIMLKAHEPAENIKFRIKQLGDK